MIPFHKRESGVVRLGGAGHQVHAHCLVRADDNSIAYRHDRIEDRPFAVGKRITMHRRRVRQGATAADECFVGRLVRRRGDGGAVNGHEVEHPGRLLTSAARAAVAEDRLPFTNDLGLDEKVAERRV